ncbi:MAG: rane dipeptidase [Paenibacillus sp.]|jgi:membrane dipeptidase|nr:rane dipeptidase [Paenibacillus sp.]
MYVIDAHCDVLSKLLMDPRLDFKDEASGLDVTLPGLKKSKVMLQWFAMWMPEQLENSTFNDVLKCVDLFYSRIANLPEMGIVRASGDIARLAKEGRIGALLTLEGADALAGNLAHLRMLYKLGLRSLGLTWNYANWAADGVMETRQGGFTIKGRGLVKECDSLGILIDASHLTDRAFWELSELTDRAFLASHSNAYTVCSHPRNLKDDQIKEIVRRKGMIGINFFPTFVDETKSVAIERLLPHIEKICELGGANHLGLGSDFDGISRKLFGLEHTGCLDRLSELVGKHYSHEQTERIMYRNWQLYLERELPAL